MLPITPRSLLSRIRVTCSRARRAGRSNPPRGLPPSLLRLEDRTAPTVFTVSTTADMGAGSLRQAILDANADTTGTNTIRFAIPGSRVHTIQPASDLPASTGPLLIDGSTQPGYAGCPLIELDGSLVPSPAVGLSVQGGNSTLEALVINRFTTSCIDLSGKGGDTVLSNYLGTDTTGTTGLAGGLGVHVTSANNTIGGTATGAGNLISGNVNDAIDVLGSGNLIQGNRLGTDVTGSRVLAPNRAGISVRGAQASNNTIGGTASGAGNLIAGFIRFAGIDLESCSGTVIQGNKIGTDITGTQALANKVGVVQIGGSGTTLGGTTAGAGNLISGNSLINADLNTSTASLVQGNRIGTDATGTTALDTTSSGVNGLDVTGNNCTIGGTATGAGNLISGNSGTGLNLGGTQGSMVLGNLIGTDLTGSKAIPNWQDGVDIYASSVTVGGSSPGAGNLLSGNLQAGIRVARGSVAVIQGNRIGTDVTGTRAVGNAVGVAGGFSSLSGITTLGGTQVNQGNLISGNTVTGVQVLGFGMLVEGNRIGTDASGSQAVPNGDGVTVVNYIINSNVTIGGTAPGAGNLISGNTGNGILLSSTDGTVIQGNQIGTDLSGTVALPNTTGISIVDGFGHTIGGPGAGNLISGNRGDGVTVSGAMSNRVVIQNNRIGTDLSASQVLSNGGNGVAFTGGAVYNLVGGLDPGDDNLIAFNGGYGVLVDAASNDLIWNNTLLYNAAGGIGLLDGGNDNQPAPTLTSAVSSGGTLTVQGTLHAQANTTYTIELYVNSDPAAANAQFLVGFVQVTTDANGDAAINLSLAVEVPPGWAVTATATDPLNNTSMLAAPRVVTS
jgi:titin